MEMNGILLVDKPADWTSHDVVAKLKGVLREKKIGHSGTLDPMATGLLVIFLGRATRAVEFAEAAEKEYIAGIRTGIATDTQDITGTVTARSDKNIDDETFNAVLPRFTGKLRQLPPMYSAIKINGQKLYDIARKGGTVERKPREICISELESGDRINGDRSLHVRCSKGTYIRTLCFDIGEALGCHACMSYLRRTRAGAFGIEQAHTLTEVIDAAGQGGAEALLLPVDTIFEDYPAVTLTPAQEKKVRNGMRFGYDVTSGIYRAYSPEGDFLALMSMEDGEMRTIKSFYEVDKA